MAVAPNAEELEEFLTRGVSQIVVRDELAEKAVQAISSSARTGKIGDGKIFISKIDDAIRIRNDERGESAL